jgi:MFS family permease
MPLFAFPVIQLLPVVAKDVFSSPDIGLGVLAVAGGVGGLIGSLASASFDNFERKGFLMLIGSLIMAICFIAFAVSPVLVVAAVVLAAGNVGQMIFMTTNNTVIQATVPDEFRGRVMSMLMMSFGISPLGVLPVAVAADTLGVQWAIGLSAVVFLVLVIVVFSVNKRLRNLALSQFEEAELSPAQAAQLVAEGKITREEAARLTGRAQPATGG